MPTTNDEILRENLSKLSKSDGALVFSLGDYYVQFAKDPGDNQFLFEAVSFHFLESLPQTLTAQFSRMGFEIDDGNYFKHVNSGDFDLIIQEVKKIFTELYGADYSEPFEVMDDVNS